MMFLLLTVPVGFVHAAMRFNFENCYIFSSYGCDLHLDNELVANAFAALPKQEQSILILFCVLELGDGEIGDLMGMSRSAVQRHRTKTLNELRKKLKAHLPEGG